MRGLTELSIFKSDAIKKAVVLLSGSGSNFQAILDSITANEIALEISSVISNVPGVRGIDRAKLTEYPLILLIIMTIASESVLIKLSLIR